MLKDLAHAGQTLLDPYPWRSLKDLLPIAPQTVEFFSQRVDFALGLQQRVRKGAAAAALADEVDEVRKAPLLGAEFRLFEPNRLGDVGVEFGDFRLDALEDVLDMLRGGELLTNRVEDDALGETAAAEQFVLAGTLGRGDTAVVAAAFPADLRHRGPALPAGHGARKQMRREEGLAAALRGGEAAPSRAARPGSADVLPPCVYSVPEFLRHDA